MKIFFLLLICSFMIARAQSFDDLIIYTSSIDTLWDEIVFNGTFDSNLSGWSMYNDPTPIIYEWVSSGGGFTGACHIKNDVQYSGLQTNLVSPGGYVFLAGETYRYSLDLNIISGSTTWVGPKIYFPIYYVNLNYQGPNIIHVSQEFTISTPASASYVWVIMGSNSNVTEFYIDNISIKKRRIVQ